jgi:putative hydrolase of the HAD superfamily
MPLTSISTSRPLGSSCDPGADPRFRRRRHPQTLFETHDLSEKAALALEPGTLDMVRPVRPGKRSRLWQDMQAGDRITERDYWMQRMREVGALVGEELAILSNELDLFYGADFRDKLPFLADFDVIVDATYTNILKPDPRAYRACLDRARLPPEACVFVDDQARNIAGARKPSGSTPFISTSNRPARKLRRRHASCSVSLETTP